jgi:hypothetical protein
MSKINLKKLDYNLLEIKEQKYIIGGENKKPKYTYRTESKTTCSSNGVSDTYLIRRYDDGRVETYTDAIPTVVKDTIVTVIKLN